MRAKKWIYDKEKQTVSINPESDLWPRAFQNYRSVVEFTLPDEFELLPDGCFSGCIRLEKINLPQKLVTIGTGCFKNCESLKEIVIPAGVEEIADEAFAHCHELETVIFEGTVHTIGKRAFYGTKLKKIQLPQSIAKIGDESFANIATLEKLHLPENLCSLGNEVFPDHGAMMEISSDSIDYPVSDNLLYNQDKTELIYLPPADERKRLALAEGLKAVYSGSCRGQQFVEELILPASLTHIGAGAFAGMPALRYVRFLGDGLNLSVDTPEGVEREEEHLKRFGVFADTSQLEQVILPAQLKEIPAWMFLASGLSYIDLPQNLSGIHEGAFACCGFKEVTIPAGVNYIGTGAFYGTHYLTLPDGVHTDNGDLANIAGDVAMRAWPRLNWHNHWLKVAGVPALWFGAADDMGRVMLQSIFVHDQVNLQSYDDAFQGATGIENRIRMAVSRLTEPVQLSQAAKERYMIFLDQFALHALKLLLSKQAIGVFRDLTETWPFPTEKLAEGLKMAQDSGQTKFIQQMLAIQRKLQPQITRRKRL